MDHIFTVYIRFSNICKCHVQVYILIQSKLKIAGNSIYISLISKKIDRTKSFLINIRTQIFTYMYTENLRLNKSKHYVKTTKFLLREFMHTKLYVMMFSISKSNHHINTSLLLTCTVYDL